MNNMLKYTKMLLLFVLVLGLTSCDSEEETEYNLPGEWYTSEEIDFGAYTWGRGTIMTFNARNQGTIGSYGDPNYLLFRWNWVSGAYNLMELEFMMMAAWLTLKEPWLILILSVVLGIIAGGNIKIIFTDSLFVSSAMTTCLSIKNGANQLLRFLLYVSFYLFFKTNFLNSPG